MTDIPEDEFNNIIREKAVIEALTENRWLVEVSENLFSLFEDKHWIDEDTRREVRELNEFTESKLDRFELDSGYDVEEIKSLDEDEQIQLAENLNNNTAEAYNYTHNLLQRLGGHHDVIDSLPDIIQENVEVAFENYDGFGNLEVELNYGDLAQELEQNIDYDHFTSEIDTTELSAAIASDIGVDETVIASELEVSEEEIADYINETQIAAGLDEAEIGRNVEVHTECNGTVYVDPADLETAFNQADIDIDIDNEVNLDQHDYRKIGREASNHIDIDLTQNDYQQIGQAVANNIDVDIDDSDNPSEDEDYELGFMERVALVPIKVGDVFNYGGDN